MNVDPKWLSFAWQVLVSLASGVALVMAWLERRGAERKREISHLQNRMDDLERRHEKDTTASRDSQSRHFQALRGDINKMERQVATIETRLEGLPTGDDIRKIHEVMAGVSGQVHKLSGSTEAAQNQLAMIHQYLLTQKQ